MEKGDHRCSAHFAWVRRAQEQGTARERFTRQKTTEENEMYALVDHQILRQRRQEIQREVASNRLERTARANHERRPLLVLDLVRVLARHGELLGKRLSGIG